MTSWEEAVKNKLEAYESTPPEGVFAEIQRRRGAAPARRPVSRSRLWLPAAALAAAVAALIGFFSFRETPRPEPVLPSDVTARVETPVPAGETVETVEATETTESPESVPANSTAPQPPVRKKAAEIIPAPSTIPVPEEPLSGSVAEEAGPAPAEATEVETGEIGEISEEPAESRETAQRPEFSPYPEYTPPVALRLNPRLAAGALLGAGAVGSLVAMLAFPVNKAYGEVPFNGSQTEGGYASSQPYSDYAMGQPTSDWKHSLPFRAGLSARVAVTPRLFVTTGVQYSLYRSRLSVAATGGTMFRTLHYLGIPLRLDRTLYAGKNFEAYLGAGLEGDICIAARMEGSRIERNPAMLSLLGVGGVQVNLTKRLGLYLEPELSYSFPLGQVTWITRQTEQPFLFTVSGGVRINLNVK